MILMAYDKNAEGNYFSGNIKMELEILADTNLANFKNTYEYNKTTVVDSSNHVKYYYNSPNIHFENHGESSHLSFTDDKMYMEDETRVYKRMK